MTPQPLDVVIIDRPGASSGCACGGATDPELPRFAGDVEWLRRQDATVRRLDPRDHRAEIGALPAARTALDQRGTAALPLVLIDGDPVHSGSYPSRASLEGLLRDARRGRGVT